MSKLPHLCGHVGEHVERVAPRRMARRLKDPDQPLQRATVDQRRDVVPGLCVRWVVGTVVGTMGGGTMGGTVVGTVDGW